MKPIGLFLAVASTIYCTAAGAQMLEPSYDQLNPTAEVQQERSSQRSASYRLKGEVKKLDKLKSMKHLNAHTEHSRNSQNLSGAVEDEDLANGEAMIEWDKWHKRFEQAVYHKFAAKLWGNDAINIGSLVLKLGTSPIPHFPVGTKATVGCDITDEGKLQNVRITSSSGNAEFDALVLKSVNAVRSKQVLRFPAGSKRHLVSKYESLWVGKQAGYHYSPHNDVEKIVVSKND